MPADLVPKIKGFPPDLILMSLFWCLQCHPGPLNLLIFLTENHKCETVHQKLCVFEILIDG